MSSRRSRIKGIANIPLRRKASYEETDSKLMKFETPGDESMFEIHIETKGSHKSIAITNTDAINNKTSIKSSKLSDLINTTENIKVGHIVNKLDNKEISRSVDNQSSINKKISADKKNAKIPVALNTYERQRNPQKVASILEKHLPQCYDNSNSHKKEILSTTENCISDESSTTIINNDRLENTNLPVPKKNENLFQKPISVISNTPNSDTEYPLPPPSPNKASRSRIKAVPRLTCRKTSFSASESEDESRKIHRIRNDSVCSITSLVTESISDCFSPHRPKEMMTAAGQFKKISMRSEQTRKLAEARKEFIKRFGASKPERHRLTMMDLIFYNPDSNPMMGDAVENENENEMVDNPVVVEEKADDPVAEENTKNDEEHTKSDEENTLPVPQIKIGPSGEIILDEQSFLIERKEVEKQRDEIQRSKIVDADQIKTGYGIYKKNIRTKYWTHSETLLFYKALNTIGTDFMLMSELFPNRTRRDLKIKFKKEEKVNRHLIDRALMQPCNFDFEDLKSEVETKERELKEVKKQNEEERKQKEAKIKGLNRIMMVQTKKKASEVTVPKPKLRPNIQEEMGQVNESVREKSKKDKYNIQKPKSLKKPRKEKLSIKSYMSDSDADESDLATQSESDEDVILPHKPTRSGRVPKLIHRYDNELTTGFEPLLRKHKMSIDDRPNNLEPGSLMITNESGPNGEPVYKIYMVTTEQQTTIDVDSEIVTKAIQMKKGISAQNILTISSNVKDDEETPLENNVTISEDRNVVTLKSDENN